jgi:hypothetical protein
MLIPTLRTRALFLISFAIGGCSLFDSGTEWEFGNFEVLWIDLTSSSHLAYRLSSTTSIQIVESCVFEAGANSKRIVVKQRPNGSSVTNFYVVQIDKYAPEKDIKSSVIGPLSESEYRALSQEMPMPAFTKIFSETVCNERV